MLRSSADVSMGDEGKREDDEEMGDEVPPLPVGFSTPKSARRRPQAREGFEFSVTPEPSRTRLSTSRGRQGPEGLEESPARYSPSKVKEAVRSFADFLHFLEQKEHQQEHELMPVIIQRFAELGAVIESQKRHIDRWKSKELDLAIEEAQHNLEVSQDLGQTIDKLKLQLAAEIVERQKWEEKYHLAAQEVESLKEQGTYQIQQLRSEIAMLRQAGVDVETKLKGRDASLESMRKANEKLQSQLKQMDHDSSVILQENTALKQQGDHQSGELRTLKQQVNELREHYEAVVSKATELEQDVSAWQSKYEEREHLIGDLEDALHRGRQEMGEREENMEQQIAENRELRDHIDRVAQEHEHELAEHHRFRSETEAEHQRLTQTLQQESSRFQKLKKEAGEIQAQIEAQAMSAMKQREQQLLDEKARVEEELQHQFSKINQENIALRANVESLKDIIRQKSTEFMAISEEAHQQQQSHNRDTEIIRQLTDDVEGAKQRLDTLSKEFAAKEAAMNLRYAEIENQYNDLGRENDQLRAGQTSADREELDEWRAKCEKLQYQSQKANHENDSLMREVERLQRELEHSQAQVESIHAEALEQQAALQNTIRLLDSEKEDMKLNMASLSSERSALEHQVTSARSEIEYWKATFEKAAESKIQEIRQEATEQIKVLEQNTAMAMGDGRNQLQNLRVELEEREAHMNEGKRQLQTLQNSVRSFEGQVHTQQRESENLQRQLESLHHEKRELEFTINQIGASFIHENQPELEGNLPQKLEQVAYEMKQRLREECEKSARLQAVLDSTQGQRQQHFNEQIRRLEDDNLGLQHQLNELSAQREELDGAVQHLQQERKEKISVLEVMQQKLAAYEEEKWTRSKEVGDFKRVETAHKELEATYEQLKNRTAVELKEKENRIGDLEDELAEVQSKLDQEKEMSRHLMDRSRAEKHENADELSKKSQIIEGQKERVRELETMVKTLQHELQVNEQSKTGKEQNFMHEKLQKERELRSLQAQYDRLVVENAAALKEMDAKTEEVIGLHQDIDQLNDEIGQLHDEIRDNTTEMDNARGQLQVSERLSVKLEEMQDELAAREVEVRQHEAELAAKDEELRHARDVEHELKRDLEDKLHDKEVEITSLAQQNAKFREQLKRAAQAKLSSKNSADADAKARQEAMAELEEAYKQSVQREQDLTSKIVHLEDSKSAMLSQFRREMSKLNIEFGGQELSGNYVDDSAFHRGIMEVSALLRSYQDRETRQDSLIQRKEKQVDDLKLRLEEVEHSFRLNGSNKLKKQASQHQRDVEESFHQQLEAMSEEVSKLKLENQELRGSHRADKTEDPNNEAAREWEVKCLKLKHRVRELKDANAKLKEGRFSKADMKALVKEVEHLTSQILEKDMQLQALQKRENVKTSRLKNSSASAAATGSRRSKNLLIALQEKEDKIMILNDHLTGLMTENMRLQHNTEQYAVRYGALEGTTTNDVIGNSGIRVPVRTNSSSQQPPTVRSQ